MFDLEKLKESYCGDLCWLEELERQIVKNEKEIKDLETVLDLKELLFKMNYIIIETETNECASKYNGELYEVYRQMKLDLTEMLGISEFWEML